MKLLQQIAFGGLLLTCQAQDFSRDDVDGLNIFRPDSVGRRIDRSPALFTNGNTNGSISLLSRDVFGRQSQGTCPYPVKCGSTWCCEAGYNCCSVAPKCCEIGTFCVTEGCCPNNAETCGGTTCIQPGSVCCGGGHFCDAGEVCYPEYGLCCLPGESKCPDVCCPEGTFCAPNRPGFCARLTQSTSLSRSISISTMTSFSISMSTSLSTSLTTSYSLSLSTRTITATADDSECTPSVQRRSSLEDRARIPFPDYCVEACHLGGTSGQKQKVYVLEIPRIKGQTDQLVDSTCKGILARGRAGELADGLNDGEDILTYNGAGKGKRVTNVNCRGTCQYATTGLQCDEYPPARWTQSDITQTLLCIEEYQNSGTQAPLLSSVVRNCGMQAGDKMLVRVIGGCSYYQPQLDLGAREASLEMSTLQPRDTININKNNATLRNPLGDDSLTYVAISLGELDNGHYDLNLNLDGSVTNASVLNSDGDVLASVDSPAGGTTLSFDIDEDDQVSRSVSLIAYTVQGVSVSVNGTGTTTGSSSSASPSGTVSGGGPKVNSADMTAKEGSVWWSVVWTLVGLLI